MSNRFEIEGEEVLNGEVKPFGNSAHVTVPKRVAWRRRESCPYLGTYRTRERMIDSQALVKTLDLQLDIQSDN